MKYLIVTFLFLTQSVCADAQFFRYHSDMRPREEQTAPKFKDGKEGLERFMKKNFRNPPAIDRSIQGDVVIDVIIDEKGRVADHRVVRSVGADYDKEAVRVTKKMKFKAAKVGKEKVKSRYRLTYPIKRGRLSFVTLNTIDI